MAGARDVSVRFREWRSRFVLLFESSIHKAKKAWMNRFYPPIQVRRAPTKPTINIKVCVYVRVYTYACLCIGYAAK